MDVQIHITERKSQTKCEANRLRYEGRIPAVIYSQGRESESISLPAVEFEGLLRGLKSGFLPTTIFSLVGVDGKKRRAIIKDIQYEATTYKVLHLDFLELRDDVVVELKVPVEYTGQVDCTGVKSGGFLRFPMRHVRVRCLPAHIPSHFEIDVKNLGMNQVKKASDLSIPSEVRLLGRPNDVIATVVKR